MKLFAIFNIVGLAGLAIAIRQGFLSATLEKDHTFISFGVIGMWVVLLLTAGYVAYDARKSRALEWLYIGGTVSTFLGLLGTFIGFSIALQSAGAASSAAEALSSTQGMLHGLSSAVWTSIVGAIFGLWSLVNYWILGGTRA